MKLEELIVDVLIKFLQNMIDKNLSLEDAVYNLQMLQNIAGFQTELEAVR